MKFFWRSNKIDIITKYNLKRLFLSTITKLTINDDAQNTKKGKYCIETSFHDTKNKQHTVKWQKSKWSRKYNLEINGNLVASGSVENRKKWIHFIVIISLISSIFFAIQSIFIVSSKNIVRTRTLPIPEQLEKQSQKFGKPRVEQIAPNVFVAIGFEFTNTILIRTEEGNVIIDTSISPVRAKQVKAALHKVAPGPTKAIIFTHSHIDHVGGASEWQEENTQIWATENFIEHTIKQYGVFNKLENIRGNRQFGLHVPHSLLPCFALGNRVPTKEASTTGLRLPTHTFSGKKILTIGKLEFHLIEAHGETHDQLFVWIPQLKVLAAGDNFYDAFPNIYTIRGTKPRPVDEWIRSLDKMRRCQSEILIPGHTLPIKGKEKIAQVLRNYRDGIQWIRDEVVRRANRGESVEKMVEEIGLPPHLAKESALTEIYGQIDWSVRAIYSNEIGWFDGRADQLYPMPFKESMKREVEKMGGATNVMQMAVEARKQNDYKWSVHLLAKLREANIIEDENKLNAELAKSYQLLGESVFNTNGRGYLLEMAYELENEREEFQIQLNEKLVETLPTDIFLKNMCLRLIPEKSIDITETVLFDIRDIEQKFFLTIRNGIAELAITTPLPGTPQPIATVITDSMTWKKLALKKEDRIKAVTDGRLKVEGDKIRFIKFLQRFNKDL